MAGTERVKRLTELTWNFHDSGGAHPTVYPQTDKGRYGARISVDPFPAYPHDVELVAKTLDAVTAAFPLPEPFAPVIFVLEHEVLSRTNGQAGYDMDYDWEPPEDDSKDEANQRPWRGYVILSAKRIPPHPAMTRYLVAHEYGHVVEDWLARQRGFRVGSGDLLKEYATLRGHEGNANASGGRWHSAIQEVFANDFRVLRANFEREFWPHPGVPQPYDIDAVVDFWRSAH